MNNPAAAPAPSQVQELISIYTQGKLEEALTQGAALIAEFPRAAVLHNIVGAANMGLKRLDTALQNYRQALEINPRYAEAHNNMANALRDKGDLEAAIASYQEAIRLKPDYAEAHNNIGTVLLAQGQAAAAIASFGRALELKPDYATASNNMAAAHNGLGLELREQGDFAGAAAHYRTAIKFNPAHFGIYNNLGHVLHVQGDLAGAIENLERALKLDPGNVRVHRNLSVIRKYKAGDPQIDQMRKIAAQENLSPPDKIQLGFALGKACDDIGEVDEAFTWFSLGNRLRKEELGYDILSDLRQFNLIKESFAQLPAPPPGGQAGHRPVFILGMPRSGTTLVEQILASHSAVFGAGELSLAWDSLKTAGWPPRLSDDGYLSRFREEYLQGLSALGVSETFVTDKMPLNFRWIGFILSSMPEAVVVHARRDARATCWSVFKHYFSGKGNHYSYDLADAVAYYKMYADMMDFWHEKFPGRIYDLSYEELTQNQEEETRKLLRHVGLDWEDACLEFHKSDRVVLTNSSTQVRQKMYGGSSEGWKKYEKHLGAMIEGLKGY
jgi:tetratricopeptide (TPR) repeat protein